MIQTILNLLGTGLEIWRLTASIKDRELANKYFEEWRYLSTRIKDEESLPDEKKDEAVIDNLSFELMQLSAKFTASATPRPNTLNQ